MFSPTNWKGKFVPSHNDRGICMSETHLDGWTAVTRYLRTAALLPQQRDEIMAHALQTLLACIPAVGTALLWPWRDGKVPWKVYYAGMRQDMMRSWLSARLTSSLDVMMGVLQHDLTRSLPDMPSALLIRLQPSPVSLEGLWIIWPASPATLSSPSTESGYIERVRQTLEAILEVESKEGQYFSTSSPLRDAELIKALASGDVHALSAVLSLTRVMANADVTFLGRVYRDVLETANHLGARQSGFGFVLPQGRGIGGRVAAYGVHIEHGDYLNSPYREPEVCEIVDNEQIRSGIALPVRDGMARVSAVLYATRRTVTPFSLAERLFIQRLIRALEPLPLGSQPASFLSPGVQHLPDHKASWYNLVLHADRIETVEEWIQQIIKGPAIVTDDRGSPYVFAHAAQLEQFKALQSTEQDAVQVISLAAPGVSRPGWIYLSPSVALPPPHWPDFYTDVVMVCNLALARMEQAQDQLARQRQRWLQMLLEKHSLQQVERDSYRLGLPIERGQLWVIAWSPEAPYALKGERQRMIAENVVLENLKSPLIFLDDTTGVVLCEGQMAQKPSTVRDALLKHSGSHPLWIVHGARYHSLHDLKLTLAHAIALAHKVCREGNGEYLVDVYAPGLDSLLDNPRLTADLDAFAARLLTPLIEYDAANHSHLTETFVLAQTLGSTQAVAEQLALHANTVRYRLRRAESILGSDQASAKERTAMALAAFIWKNFRMAE